MAVISVDRLQVRKGVCHYRKRTPKDLLRVFVKEWKFSLKRKRGQEKQAIKLRGH